MTFESATVVIAVVALFFQAVRGLREQRPSSFVSLGLAFYGAVLASSTSALSHEFGAETVASACATFAIGSLLFIILLRTWQAILDPAVGSGRIQRWQDDDLDRYAAVGPAFVAAGLFLVIVDRETLSATWIEARAASSVVTAGATFLLLLGLPSIACALLRRRWVTAALTAAMGLVASQLTGSRAIVLSAALLGLWLVLSRVRSRVAFGLLAILGTAAALALQSVLRAFRSLGPEAALAQTRDGTIFQGLQQSFAAGNDISGGEFAIVRYFVFSVHASGDERYGFLTTVTRFLEMPIPSSLGIDKPQDVTYTLWGHAVETGFLSESGDSAVLASIYAEGNWGSLHPTLFGETFVSGGWVSLVLSLVVLTLAMATIDAVLSRLPGIASLVLLGAVLAGYMFIARGNSVIGLGFFVYTAPVLWLLAKSRTFIVPPKLRAPA